MPKTERRGNPLRSETVEVFADPVNAWVVRTSGRRFPGLILQGDTLSTLHAEAAAALMTLREGRPKEALDELENLEDRLRGLVLHYQHVLSDRDSDLPFTPLLPDEDQAARLFHEHLYAVVRLDDPAIDEMQVTVKEIVQSKEAADAEAERLNSINADKSCRYVVQLARVVPAALRRPTRHGR